MRRRHGGGPCSPPPARCPLGGRRSDVGAVDVLALATALGLPEATGRRVLRDAVEKVDTWLPLLDELPYDLARRRKLARVVTHRRARLSP